MSKFKERLRVLAAKVDDPATAPQRDFAMLTLAEGLAEVIALLRPLVETVTAKSEPLTLRTDVTGPMPCLAGDPGSNGFRRCMEPYGHDGDHRHRDGLNAGVEHVWTQRHGDVPKFEDNSTTEVKNGRGQRCRHFGPVTDRGAFGVRRPVCNRNPGHPGPHGTGIVGETWLR